MRLDEAIKAAARFAGDDNYSYLRFLPAEGNWPARLLGMNSKRVGVFCRLDVPVPNVIAHGKDLVQAARDDVARVQMESGRLVLFSQNATHYVEVRDPVLYPAIPGPPSFLAPFEEWTTVKKLLHMAGESKTHPEAACIQFLESHAQGVGAGAFGVDRFGWADVIAPLQGFVPAEVFEKIGAAENVWASVVEGMAWVRAGGELRFAAVRQETTQPIRAHVPDWHTGCCMVAPAKELLEACRQAAGVDGTVRLDFGLLGVTVRGRGLGERAFEQRVTGIVGLTGGTNAVNPEMAVHGRYLVEALKGVDTPMVRLGYDAKGLYLRLESGGWVQHILTIGPDYQEHVA